MPLCYVLFSLKDAGQQCPKFRFLTFTGVLRFVLLEIQTCCHKVMTYILREADILKD